MTIDFVSFLAQLAGNPVLVVVVLLNIGVIIVNGATDAPNAIATVVSTRAMKPRTAILMAAACNFVGLFVVSLFTSAGFACVHRRGHDHFFHGGLRL